MSFVSASVTSDPTVLLDDAIDVVNAQLEAAGYPGWSANDPTLAVITLSTVAQMAADLGSLAGTVMPAVFRSFGTQLLGIPYQNGTAASVLSTWTFTSAAPTGGYLIEQGTTVLVSGEVFYVQADVTTATGALSAVATLVSAQNGAAYNSLGGVNAPAELYEQLDWVASVVTQGLTSGGADQEDDTAYQNKLTGALQLQAPRPLVQGDFAGMLLSDLAENATGISVGRATDIDGYYPDGRLLSSGGAGSTVLTCSITSGSPTVTVNSPSGTQVPTPGTTVTGTGIPGGATVLASPAPTESTFTLSANATATNATASLTVGAMSGYGPTHLTATVSTTSGSPAVSITAGPYRGAIPEAGARVRGTGIPSGATVLASPAPTASSFTLSANATATGTGVTVTASSWTSVPLANTSFATDVNGNAETTANMDVLQTWLAGYRPQNWLTFVAGPSQTLIYVSCLVKVLPGYDPAAVAANVQGALLSWLNAATWGQPPQSAAGAWMNVNTVRYKQAIAVATQPGVQYVDTLALGTSPSPSGTADIVLTGPAPLATSTSASIVVSTE